jgi:hypothetical protein
VYIEIHKGMYGLPQAGILAKELLRHNLVSDILLPGYPYNPWISIGLNYKNMETFKPQSSIVSLASVYLAKTDVSGAKVHVDSLHVPNLQD